MCDTYIICYFSKYASKLKSKYWQSDYNYFHYIFVFTRHKRQAFWTRKHLFRVKQVYPMICWKKMLKLYLFSIYIVYFLSLIIDCNSSNMFILLAKPQRKQIKSSQYSSEPSITGNHPNTTVYRLNQRLWDGYSNKIKPVKSWKTVLYITIDLTLRQILHVVSLTEYRYLFLTL